MVLDTMKYMRHNGEQYSFRSKIQKAGVLKAIIAVFLAAFILAPLVRMFFYIGRDSINNVITSPLTGTAIKNSLVSSAIATAITMVLAYTTAYAIERSNMKGRNFFSIVFVVPMLIPSISHGMGILLVLGNNGLLRKLLNLKFSIYGLPGILLGSVLYAFPIAFLMLSDVMKYEDSSPYEAAQVLGVDRLHQFTAITFPYIRKPIITIVFAIFTVIITDYGVPLMVGGTYTTIAIVLYQEVIGRLNFGTGVLYGIFLLIPAVIAFIIDLNNNDSGNSSFVTKAFTSTNSRLRKCVGYIICSAVAAIILLLVISFVQLGFTGSYSNSTLFTLAYFKEARNYHLGKYLLNSVIIAAAAAFAGMSIALATAYLTTRMESKASRALHLLAITSAAIPGIVLGLSYILTFKNTALYGTLFLLMLVNTIHFFSSPYLMMYNSLSKLNENLEGVGFTLGISRGQLIRDIIIPQCKGTLVEMFIYFFVNCMITISAVSFLATSVTKPVSLMITQFEAQMKLECAAIVSLCILIVNICAKAAAYYLKNREFKTTKLKHL
ncbi:MAG: ABC transporter permease subunit [Oscillospiraceae bacterium]|nr:ABC transporter permease subunit [Oscillospiraceae bacterium]